MDSFLDRIGGLIESDEIEIAIAQVSALLKGSSSQELGREVLVLGGRLSRLRKQERKGFANESQVARERAKIADSLLQIVDELSSSAPSAERPFPMRDVALEAPPSLALEKIIGANNLKSIAWLQRGVEAARSVCRIVTPKGLGTGFLIGQQMVMTNCHVLNDGNVAAKSYAEFNFQEDASGKLQEFVRYRLLGDDLQSDPDLDYCVARIEPMDSLPELKSWGALTLAAEPLPAVGEHVTIIQHPGGGPKQIAVTANQVVNIFGYRLQYTTDTLPGSSGSPVFNDDWKVAALHHAGGNLVTNDRGDRMFANEGILMAKILEKLEITLWKGPNPS